MSAASAEHAAKEAAKSMAATPRTKKEKAERARGGSPPTTEEEEKKDEDEDGDEPMTYDEASWRKWASLDGWNEASWREYVIWWEVTAWEDEGAWQQWAMNLVYMDHLEDEAEDEKRMMATYNLPTPVATEDVPCTAFSGAGGDVDQAAVHTPPRGAAEGDLGVDFSNAREADQSAAYDHQRAAAVSVSGITSSDAVDADLATTSSPTPILRRFQV